MDVITIHPKQVDLRQYRNRTAQPEDAPKPIERPTRVLDQHGNVLAMYDRLPPGEPLERLAELLKGVKFTKTARTNGLTGTARTFGGQPRLPNRGRQFCSHARLRHDGPEAEKALLENAVAMAQRYRVNSETVYKQHTRQARDLNPEWRIPGTPFTSGIVNENNPLPYHLDAGNIQHVYSCMLVLRRDIEGGWLVCPELGIRFLLENGAVFMFDGQKILHGVSPMEIKSEEGYRYSIVYYSLKEMWRCRTVDDELAHARASEGK